MGAPTEAASQRSFMKATTDDRPDRGSAPSAIGNVVGDENLKPELLVCI